MRLTGFVAVGEACRYFPGADYRGEHNFSARLHRSQERSPSP